VERKQRERLRALEDERKRLEDERQLLESQKKVMEEKNRLETERLQLEKERQNLARLEAKKRLLEEKKRLKAEQLRIENEKKKIEERKKQLALMQLGDKKKESEEKQTLAYIPKSASDIIVHLREKPKFVRKTEIRGKVAEYQLFDSKLNMNGSFKNNFVDNRDGTISDRVTGLMWQQGGSSKYLRFRRANSFVKKLNNDKYAGYSDWRIPTIVELSSLLNSTRVSKLYIDLIFGEKQTKCWSIDSAPDGLRVYKSWIVNFSTGNIDLSMRYKDIAGTGNWEFGLKNLKNYVRAVRSEK